MEEEKIVDTTEEVVEETEAPIEPTEDASAKKKKLPAWIQKIVDYLKTHENARQMVMFFLFSMICGGTQFIVTLFLPMILRAADGSMSDPFKWFIFDYTNKGIGEFIGFIVGSVIGQVLTFVLNRKKTFNVSDHIPFRAIAYTIMAILIILMQTALGGAITTACGNAVDNPSEALSALFNIVGQAVAGIAALVVNFLGNKFFVMRKFKNTKESE